MSANQLPFTFEEASDEEKARRAKFYTGSKTLMVDIIR